MGGVHALVMGDPAGIGPELFVRLLGRAELVARSTILGIGDARVVERGISQAGERPALNVVTSLDAALAAVAPGRPVLFDTNDLDLGRAPVGEVSRAAGRSALANYRRALDLARAGVAEAITFVPFNKQAIRLAHPAYEDEIVEAVEHLSLDGPCAELNVIERFWNARVTSHVPLRAVADLLTPERIVERIRLTHDALLAAGKSAPRIGVAALNPHGGEGGAFGREEIEIIAPAVEHARAIGLPAEGPFPSDTIFRRAQDGQLDAVVTMYHDQGQIAIKLLGFEEGVTLLVGLPVPVTTPAHGTAFDIVGSGRASLEPTCRAFALAATMAERSRGVARAGA